MKKSVFSILIFTLLNTSILFAQSFGNQSCTAGGEMWVCGSSQQNQAHVDFDNNCSGYDYDACTVVRTIIDVCSPNMQESRIIEPGPNPEECSLLNPEF
ncbi:MAG: hypothetical protein HEP71_29725 [Roseivirga sp.]|nr:hypothetical protein [Roseivirga sp.]